ncbi:MULTISPECIES: AfsR/SARP family transcriptional regulator [Streptomyces]|uniref:AfsR/SARP family transcriptional regulator n=1 Tax=Streptomyces TaxID=1883 RepID=UPI0004BE5136|nr:MULTISPECIES: BTAD domain-containing putative transcriptional regulator [Streptomyces]
MGDLGGAGLRFGLLGPLRAWYGEQELELGRPQQRAVLAVLLQAPGRTVAVPVLVEGVWGGASPADPRKAVQLAVSRLRSAFRPYTGDDPDRMPLVRVGDGYAFRAPHAEVDATAWEELLAEAGRLRDADAPPQEVRKVLRSAQRLWVGEPLAGLPGPHAEAVRARLAEQRISAKETELELDAELGDRTDLTAEAEALALEHPGRPRLTTVLMRALYQAGRKAEALAVYEDARPSLPPDDRGPAELQLRILREDASLLPATAPTNPADPATDTWQAPDQLPAGLPDFTGRTEEVEALLDRLAAGGGRAVVVSALDGMGGVGKTTLAVHVARQVRERFPDGQLFADLRGADHTPPDPGTVLVGFLLALGVDPAEIPPDTGERSALYRSALAGRRVLVVLDNAATPGHVEPLLPGSAGCAVLITSRHRLAGLPGAHQLRLDTLPPEQALELLTRIVGAERVAAEADAAEEVVRACGLLPLAVRIAASRLVADPSLTLAALAEGLCHEHRLAELSDGERTVEATFALSYRRLDPELARAFRLMSLPDAPDLPLHCAAALLGRTEDEADELLETLVDLNLLHSPRFGRYGFHDLVRAYARGRLAAEDDAAERTAATDRLLDFCLATARNADLAARKAEPAELSLLGATVASPGRAIADGAEAVRWMRDQAEVHAAAIALGCDDPALSLDRAAELADRMGAVLPERTQTGVIADLAERIARQAAARGEHGPLALAHYLRGSMLWHINRYAESEEEIRRAVALSDRQESGGQGAAGQESGGQGAAGRKSDGQGAAGQERTERVLAKALITLGSNARTHGRYAEAAEHAGRAAAIFHRLGAQRAEGSALGEFAFSAAQTGRVDEARDAAERSARLMSASGPVSAAIGRYYLARVLRLCGDPEAALDHAVGAREEFTALQVTVFAAAAGDLAARIHAEAGRWLLAVDAAEAVLPLARRTSAALEAGLLRTLGTALDGLGRPRQARACLADSLELYERLGLADESAQVRGLLSR